MNENNRTTIILFVISALIILAIEIGRRVLANRQINKLMKTFLEGDFKTFDKMMDSRLTKYLIPPFNQDFLKLNSYLARGDEKKIDAMFSRFENVRLNAAQRDQVYRNGFYYYVGKQDANKSRSYYNKLMEITADEDDRNDLDRMFDVYINKGFKHLEETEKQLEEADDQEKLKLKALLAMMYENKGDRKKSEQYYSEIKDFQEKLGVKQ